MSELPPTPRPAPSTTASATGSSATSEHAEIARRIIHDRSAVGQVAVSPEGARVAFVVATSDVDENTTRSRVWLDDAPLTAGDHDANPVWSPDGRFLAFTSRRGEKKGDSTLHIVPITASGEVRTVCTMPDGLGELTWSPDGRWIAFTSRTRDKRYEEKDESWQAPRKVERFLSRLNAENWIFDRPQHIYVVATDGTGGPRNLTPGEFEFHGTSWLADSSAVLTSGHGHDTWDIDKATDLFVVALDGDDPGPHALTSHDGDYTHPSVSSDGTTVAFIGQPGLDISPQNARVGLLPTDARGATQDRITWISTGFDRTFVATTGYRAPVWEADDSVLAVAEDRGVAHLMRLTADGSGPPTAVTNGRFSVTGFDAAGGTIATTRATIDHPSELYVGDEVRTSVGDALAARMLGWERFTVPTTDGSDEIDCWIMRPAGFDENTRYPVLLNVHGGPHTQYGEYFFDEAQMQAAAGFVVVLGNPRGSSGRHEGWGQAIMGTKHPVHPGSGWGSVDVADVLSIIDGALERYTFCDRDRVGMLGGSYGGFMATWLAAYESDRFRAFCSERAVNNLLSEEWSSDIATYFKGDHGMSHIDDPAEYERMSPIHGVRNIDKPMLIIHSEEDWRCPIVQAEELWVALRLLGKEVDFYRFPGENHELSRSGSPVHRVQRAEIILDWFTDKLRPR